MSPPTKGSKDRTPLWDAIGIVRDRAPASPVPWTRGAAGDDVGGSIITVTGRRVWPLRPSEGDVSLEDIAHALSKTDRYMGHAPVFFSVAQHAVVVASMVPPAARAWALHHDDSEAYLRDLPAPLKALPELAFYMQAEQEWMATIGRRFSLGPFPEVVAAADRLALYCEGQWVFPVCGERDGWPTSYNDMPPFVRDRVLSGALSVPPRAWFDSWTPAMARAMYLEAHEWITGERVVEVQDA